MHHTAVLYISPSGRNIVTHGNGGHSEITLFIFVEKREKHFLKELLYSSESALEPPPPLVSATHSSHGTHFSHVLKTHQHLLTSSSSSVSGSRPCSEEITCLQMGPLAGRLGGWRAPWWIHQLAPALEKWSEASGAESSMTSPEFCSNG